MNTNNKIGLPASKFPDGFLWGAATSSHQVEGGTLNNWSEWEKKNAERLAREAKTKWQSWQREKFPEMLDSKNYISGRACDHYNHFEEDFDLAKEGGHNAHRFSIEWSRIEPEEGKFDEKEIEHYRRIIKALQKRNIEPMITLWHWTDPLWIHNIGGWENKKTAEYFLKFAEKIIQEIGNGIKFWFVINEPNVFTGMSYIQGDFPPNKKSLLASWRVMKNLVGVNRRTYKLIHKILGKDVLVGSNHNLIAHKPYDEKSIMDRFSARFLNYFRNYISFNWAKGYQDFICIHFYHLEKIEFTFRDSRWYLFKTHVEKNVSDLNWGLYPKGIYDFLISLKKYNLPIYITENGLADAQDEKREWFLREILKNIKRAIDEGVDVRGYMHWSLLDNFEWDKGFWPRFGLVEIDYKTLERKPRKSFYAYKEIIKNNSL